MKMTCRLLSALALLSVPAAATADTSVSSTTMLRFFQDPRPGFATRELAPAAQFLNIDTDKLGDGNLSLHLSGWGRLDMADKSYNGDRADGSLAYGFLKYQLQQANAQVRAGRFSVREGVLNEDLDGVSAHTDLPLGFGITAFGGATVHTANIASEPTDGKGDGIFGGRINYRYRGMLELGLSGVYESAAPSLSVPSHTTLENGGRLGSHRIVGGDVWLAPFTAVELIGHTSYNTETERVADHSYLLNIKPAKDVIVTGEFSEQHDRSFFYSSSMFASMLAGLNEKSRSLGGRASYTLFKGVECAADYHHYTRDIGNADRFGGDLRVSMNDNTLRSGLSYHYLRAGSGFAVVPLTGASASYHELRGYVMRDTSSYFAALDIIGFFFNDRIDNVQNAWELSSSVGYRFTPALTLSGDLSYGRNPQYNDDLKGLIRLTYNMNYTSKGGAK